MESLGASLRDRATTLSKSLNPPNPWGRCNPLSGRAGAEWNRRVAE